MIATQIKNYVIENKNRLEKKYIVPLTFHQALCLCFLVGWIAGFAVRIKYNGFYGALLPIRFNGVGTDLGGEKSLGILLFLQHLWVVQLEDCLVIIL